MGGIVCATRGGAGSRAVQQQAIKYANERQSELVFLYVIDLTRMSPAEEILRPAVREELQWLGRTLLRIAQKRATKSQIDSEVVIRDGAVFEEICRFLKEQSSDLLLLGAPRGTTANIAGDDVIEQLAEEIHSETGVEVEIVRPEDSG